MKKLFMSKQGLVIFIIGVLFIFVLVKNEISNVSVNKEEIKSDTVTDDSQEFVEGTIEIKGEPKSDYDLDHFSVIFEAEELQHMFESAGRMDYLKYSLYQYLYEHRMGAAEQAVIMNDYQEYEELLFFTVQVKSEAETMNLNGIYQAQEDVFTFEKYESIPGRTNAYEAMESEDD